MITYGVTLLTLFILELIFLFFLSRGITRAISSLFYILTGSHGFAVNALAIIFLPGTIIHELSHIFMAGILLVHVGEMEFMPQVRGDEVKLGSAQIGITDPFRRALIGVAPLLVGAGLIISLLWFFQDFENIYLKALTLFMIFEIGNTMFSSKKDLEGLIAVVGGLVVIGGLVLGLLYFLNVSIPYSLAAQSIFTQSFADFMQKSSLYLLVPIGINLVIYALAKVLVRR